MKALAVYLVLFFVGCSSVFVVKNASALESSSWTAGVPIVARNIPTTPGLFTGCQTFRRDVFVSEVDLERSVCLYGDERLKIGTFNDGSRNKAVVGFAYSRGVHILEGICDLKCYYSADTDQLVTLQPIGQFGTSLVIYAQARHRVHVDTSSTQGTRYVFDTSHPDYEMKNDVGRYILTPSFGVSQSGSWVVAELRDQGLATVNTQTFSAKQITTVGISYGRGLDPSEQLAVSDDGKSVALAGQNAGFQVFDVTEECGQPLIDTLSVLAATKQCPSTDLGIRQLFPNFALAEYPRFFGNGHQLEVTVSSWVEGSRSVRYMTHGTAIAHQLKLLTLGDSFSSGEGELGDEYYQPGTNQLFDRCHVSIRSYAALVARQLGIHDDQVRNVACSGARIGDIVGSLGTYWGQGDRLGVSGLGVTIAERNIVQQTAITTYQPGRALQSAFVEQYDPEIMTIGVGGNDAGLMGKLRTCAMPGTCEWVKSPGREQTADEIQRLYDTLSSFFSEISTLAPRSKIFVLGYPNIIDPEGLCDPLMSFLLDKTERVFIQNSVRYVNTVIRASADKAGFQYVDLDHSFDGSNLCSPDSSAMNGVRIGDDVALSGALPMLKIIGTETFHPTPRGHALIAETLLAQYPGLIANPNLSNNDTIEVSPYWKESGAMAERAAYLTEFAYKDEIDTQHIKVQVPEDSLLPGSTAVVEIHSDPEVLGTFVVNDQGAVSGVISITDSLKEGFHTLHLLAATTTGELVDMYQFITIDGSGGVVQVGTGIEGLVVKTAVTEGTKQDAVVSAATMARAKSVQPGIAGILGVSDTNMINDVVTAVEKSGRPLVASIQATIRKPWVWIILATIGCLTFVSTLCVIFIQRRWVKRGS